MGVFPTLILKPLGGDIPRNGLVAEWLFSGNDLDTSGNGNDAIANTAVLTDDRKGSPNSAYSFDGVNQKINMNDYSDLQGFTAQSISCWIKIDVLEVFKAIIWKGANALPNGYAIQINSSANAISYIIRTPLIPVTRLDTISPITTGVWYNVTATYDGSIMKIYLDGFFQDSIAATGVIGGAPGEDLIVGNVTSASDFYFDGDIDDIRIYDRTLSQEEITILANE